MSDREPLDTIDFSNRKHKEHHDDDERTPIDTIDFSNRPKPDIKEQILGPTEFKTQKDHKAYVQELHNHLKEHFKKSPEEHKKTIRDYSGAKSGHLNSYLRKHYKAKTEFRKGLREHAPKIEHDQERFSKQVTAATNGPAVKRSFHVYTGVPDSPFIQHKILFKKDPHSTRHLKTILPAHTSTSIDHKVADDFAEGARLVSKKYNKNHAHVLKIHVPKGSKAGRYIGHESSHREEREFLLHKNTKLDIHPVPEIRKNSSGMLIHTWHAKIVEPSKTHPAFVQSKSKTSKVSPVVRKLISKRIK